VLLQLLLHGVDFISCYTTCHSRFGVDGSSRWRPRSRGTEHACAFAPGAVSHEHQLAVHPRVVDYVVTPAGTARVAIGVRKVAACRTLAFS
jgi:hypothetical protein